MTAKNVVVVAGVHGVSGKASAIAWANTPDTKVYGLSRRSAELPAGVEGITVDLLDRADVEKKLGGLKDVTHVVFAAYVEKSTASERSKVNVALVQNLVEVVEAASPSLKHVAFYQGGKAYGSDLGPFKTPAREDDPRLMSPNFYYDQEDFLRRAQVGKSWHWTSLRPEAIIGYANGNPMNLGVAIAVYATISKELGIPLRFPGTQAAYTAMYQVSSADLLADATVWAGLTPGARDDIFNITNGDQFRWQHMWPRIARMFDMEVADPVPMPLAEYMTDKTELWDSIVAKYGLQNISYEQLVSWRFADFIFASGFDNVSSTIKARKAGFHGCIDSEEMFASFFASLRELKIIP
ncbi:MULTISPECIES: SDR family oxidoreductase [unclassified Rhizobium]|uniref:SDR family oxidoreductase n=1 Tax=unclassified Rhizobium TaxID=2613769 RepID=UPI001AD9EBFD|nr:MULTISPECIES: SDR family oxidoreductase [unclassified Rhizobium]MBO9123774.1 SDR family oxidoreductase [Rhizobium sp. 16-488-2b]MBO9174306.1 SDR family oxidoreductase [Rhizobium sp. 16-488-2a]